MNKIGNLFVERLMGMVYSIIMKYNILQSEGEVQSMRADDLDHQGAPRVRARPQGVVIRFAGQRVLFLDACRWGTESMEAAFTSAHEGWQPTDRPCCPRRFRGNLFSLTCSETTITRAETTNWTPPGGPLRAAKGGLR